MSKQSAEYWRDKKRQQRAAKDVQPVDIPPVQPADVQPNVTANVQPSHRPPRDSMTPTDRLFEIEKPGYFIFDGKLAVRNCFQCSTRFETRLDLNKFCSPDCKRQYLKGMVTYRQHVHTND